jgi:hypothetical protein
MREMAAKYFWVKYPAISREIAELLAQGHQKQG